MNATGTLSAAAGRATTMPAKSATATVRPLASLAKAPPARAAPVGGAAQQRLEPVRVDAVGGHQRLNDRVGERGGGARRQPGFGALEIHRNLLPAPGVDTTPPPPHLWY
jgi:hypothetical protein